MLLRNQVKFVGKGQQCLFFNVKDYSVKYDKPKDLWICTCQAEVYRGDKIEIECSHILAVRMWLKAEELN